MSDVPPAVKVLFTFWQQIATLLRASAQLVRSALLIYIKLTDYWVIQLSLFTNHTVNNNQARIHNVSATEPGSRSWIIRETNLNCKTKRTLSGFQVDSVGYDIF